MNLSRSDLTILLIWLTAAILMIAVTEFGIALIIKDFERPTPPTTHHQHASHCPAAWT